MILRSIKCCFGFGFLFLVIADSVLGQGDFLDPRIRGYVQSSAPSSFYMQEMDVPSIMQGQAALEEMEEFEEKEPFEAQEILFDKKVDPDEYIVGPGDIIGLYLWGDLDREFKNNVTPEGLLIIPTVGDMMVADLSLSEVRRIVKDKVSNQYENIESRVFLVRPRQFRLFIFGLVLNPGMIGANSLERVSDIIERAGLMYVEKASMIEAVQNIQFGRYEGERSFSQERLGALMRGRERSSPYGVIENDAQIIKKGSSQRSIKVLRNDEVIEVDLLHFRKLGDMDNNPYITMGDRIHVPQYNGDIIITGEVNDPERYEFKQGDRITDLVTFGGGLTVLADTSRVTLVRFFPDGHSTYSIDINLYDALIDNPDDPQYILRESDRLFVWRKYNYKNMTTVVIDGQVKYPGKYPITPGVTKLSEIIKQAGGFTPEANLSESRFIRRLSSATADLEYQRLRRMSRYEMTEEEYDFYKSRSRTTRGKITVDFVQLFNDHDMRSDVILQHGDNIFVPIIREFVQVSGAVIEPGYLRLEPNVDYKHYISLAGNYKWDAKKRKVRIIKGKTGQRFKPGKDIIIEGGDTIHVPEKVPLEKWEFVKDTALVFANIATIIILAQQLTK